MNRNNIGVLQSCCRGRFNAKTLNIFRSHQVNGKNLKRNITVKARVIGLINNAHSAFAQNLDYPVLSVKNGADRQVLAFLCFVSLCGFFLLL